MGMHECLMFNIFSREPSHWLHSIAEFLIRVLFMLHHVMDSSPC